MTNTHPHYLYSDIVNSIKADKAVIEAMAGLLDGTIAYATDTNEFGTYSAGSDTWTWLGAGALLYVQDEGVPIGTPNTLNFVGNNIDVSISGTVARVFVTGTGNPTPVGFNAILPGIYAYATGSTSVPHNTNTVINVGGITRNDWNGWSASEPNKIRMNETGFYMIGGNMTWSTDPGVGRRTVSLFVTGSSVVWKYPSQSLLDNPTYAFPEQTVSTLQYLYSGSYIQLEALQTSSGTISNFPAGTSLWASKLIVSGSVQGSVTNVTNTTNVTNNLPGFLVQDEGTPLGTGTVFNFTGDNVTASISGSVVQVYVTGSSGGNLNIQDEGTGLGTATILNFVGSPIDVSVSGTVARVFVTGSPGVLLDMQTNTYTNQTGTTTTIPADNTIPQNTEGGQVMEVSITPKSSSSRLEVDVVLVGATNPQLVLIAALFRDDGANAIAVASFYPPGGNTMFSFPLHASVTAGSTNPTTFKLRIGPHAAGTAYINGTSGGRLFGDTIKSSITVREYTA